METGRYQQKQLKVYGEHYVQWYNDNDNNDLKGCFPGNYEQELTHHKQRVVNTTGEGHVLPGDGDSVFGEEGFGADYSLSHVPGHTLSHLHAQLVRTSLWT